MVETESNPHLHLVADGSTIRADGEKRCALGHRVAGTVGNNDGVFASWAFDGTRLTIETDRYGMHPLFVYVGVNEIAVSPSLVTLLDLAAPKTLDLDALGVFVHTGFFLGDETPFLAIRALPPSGRLTWTRDGVTMEGGFFFTAPMEIERDEAIGTYIDLFRQAIRKRPPHGKVAIPLSGGRDSRHILLEYLAAGHMPDTCVTAHYFPPRPDEDALVATRVAESLGVSHILLDQDDECASELRKNIATGFCAGEHAWFDIVATFLSNGFDTIYDGIAGDVLSAGLYLTPDRLADQARGEYAELAEVFISPRRTTTLKRLLNRSAHKALSRTQAIERIAAELAAHADAPNPIGSFCFWNRTRRQVALAPFAMGPTTATVYAPYLDHELYDFLSALPANMLVDRSFHTDTIHRAFPERSYMAFERPGLAPLDAREQDRRFIRSLLHAQQSTNEPEHGLLAAGLRRKLRFSHALDRFRFESARLDPRLALYLCQLGDTAER